MGDGDIRPPTAPKPHDRFSWNLKYISTSETRPIMGAMSTRVVCTTARLTHQGFFFFVSSPRSQVASLHKPHAQYIVRPSGQGSAFWGSERSKFEIWPRLGQKWKIGSLCRRSVKTCSRRNSWNGMSYPVQLGTRIANKTSL